MWKVHTVIPSVGKLEQTENGSCEQRVQKTLPNLTPQKNSEKDISFQKSYEKWEKTTYKLERLKKQTSLQPQWQVKVTFINNPLKS